MRSIIVVDNPKRWPLKIPGVEMVSAREYISGGRYPAMRGVRLFNLCKSYRYQSTGYYVSLLAEARGHRPTPSVATVQDMKSQTIVRIVSGELDDLIQRSLKSLQSDRFTLSVYFGRNLAKKYDRLAAKLFSIFHTPFLRASFIRTRNRWTLQNLGPVAGAEIPEEHRTFVIEAATAYFKKRRLKRGSRRPAARYDLAILVNPDEINPPSDAKAISRFSQAAEAMGLGVELITREDYARLAEYDALFIRETTAVNHHTFRFSRRAAVEGLVVIDDPDSILKCCNKVFLAEILARRRVPVPQTMIVHKDNVRTISKGLGFPCILKRPDSSFSQGVVMARSQEEAEALIENMFAGSDLVIAQRFTPTDFDWRVGIIDNRPIYVCKYYMADGHWQIINHGVLGVSREGDTECVHVDQAPRNVIRAALSAARLIGDGFYGVDVKRIGGHAYVMEVNDNPNVDSGVEDEIEGQALYRAVMETILRRIEQKKRR